MRPAEAPKKHRELLVSQRSDSELLPCGPQPLRKPLIAAAEYWVFG
jgi:hypothetical protein